MALRVSSRVNGSKNNKSEVSKSVETVSGLELIITDSTNITGGKRGLNAAVIELDALANAVGTTTKNDDLFPVSDAGFHLGGADATFNGFGGRRHTWSSNTASPLRTRPRVSTSLYTGRFRVIFVDLELAKWPRVKPIPRRPKQTGHLSTQWRFGFMPQLRRDGVE